VARPAHLFLSTLSGKRVNVASEIAIRDLGGLIASATTLSLAVELYLKAHRIIAGISVPETHHLWTLYRSLPKPLKETIELNYNRLNPTGGSESSVIDLAIDVGNMDEKEIHEMMNKRTSPTSDTSLRGVLLRSSDAFINWRYVHEQRDSNNPTVVTYEHMRLDLIAKVLKGIAVKFIS
jgi:hypothetical protein